MNEGIAFRKRDLRTTSYGLLGRLENWDDQQSWGDFFEKYWRLIYSLAVRSGLTEAEAHDVVQETLLRVAKDIHKFRRDRSLGSFKGWLRNATRWRIADQLRKRGADSGKLEVRLEDESEGRLEEIPDPSANPTEALWEEEWRAALLETAMERVRRRVKDEHFQIFDLYVVKRWPASRITRRLGVSLPQVYVAKHRISILIKREIEVVKKQLLNGS